MARPFYGIFSEITARANSYYASRPPTRFTVSFGSQILEYAGHGFLFALVSYIFDLVPWTTPKYTFMVGFSTYNVVSAPTTHRFYMTGGLHIGAILASSILCNWYEIDSQVSIYTAITFYYVWLEVLLIRYTILDGPTDRIGVMIRLTEARAFCHFVTVALLFFPGKVVEYVFPSSWSYDPASYVFIYPLLLEFGHELAERRLTMGLSWESVYESFVATQSTVRLLDNLLVEYGSHLWYSLRMEHRIYTENLQDVTAIPPFDYSSVPLQDDEIRLIYLPRRSWNPFTRGLLEIKLVSVALHEANEYGYEAMSYTWGPEFPQKPILIMGKRHMVRQNLYNLLHARRSVLYQRNLWIDALCIDQKNDDEKPSQIRKMRDIYIDADRVVAWLDDSSDAWMARNTIIELSNQLQMWSTQADHLLNSFDRESPHWKAFMKYILHPYFLRAWICQEAGLGHDLQFYIAGQYIPFESIWYAMIAISQAEVVRNLSRENDLLGNNDFDAVKNIYTTFGLRPWESQGVSDKRAIYPLRLILSVGSRFQATDPRDKIYAFLGISNSKLARSIEPRPKVPIPELFRSVAIKLLESDDDAEYVLPHAGLPPSDNPNSSSWVPDWVRETKRTTELISVHVSPGIGNVVRLLSQAEAEEVADLQEHIESFKYTAGGMSKPMFQVDSTENRLQTLAVPIDSIIALTDNPYDHLSIDVFVHWRWLVNAERVAGIPSAALARTLIGSRLGSLIDPHPTSNPQDLLETYNTFKRNLLNGGVELRTAQYRNYQMFLGLSSEDNTPAATSPSEIEQRLRKALDFASRMKTICGGRRFCRSITGRLAVVPATARVHDAIFVIKGLQTPYVLRKTRAEAGIGDVRYRIVGECYVDGVMEGQAISEAALDGITII